MKPHDTTADQPCLKAKLAVAKAQLEGSLAKCGVRRAKVAHTVALSKTRTHPNPEL